MDGHVSYGEVGGGGGRSYIACADFLSVLKNHSFHFLDVHTFHISSSVDTTLTGSRPISLFIFLVEYPRSARKNRGRNVERP